MRLLANIVATVGWARIDHLYTVQPMGCCCYVPWPSLCRRLSQCAALSGVPKFVFFLQQQQQLLLLFPPPHAYSVPAVMLYLQILYPILSVHHPHGTCRYPLPVAVPHVHGGGSCHCLLSSSVAAAATALPHVHLAATRHYLHHNYFLL